MDKTLKNIINKTIEMKYENFISDDYEHALMKNPRDAECHDGCSEKMENIIKKLNEILPKEHQHLVGEFESAAMGLVSCEAKIAFKEGVIHGATDLNYLSEVGSIELQCM